MKICQHPCTSIDAGLPVNQFVRRGVGYLKLLFAKLRRTNLKQHPKIFNV